MIDFDKFKRGIQRRDFDVSAEEEEEKDEEERELDEEKDEEERELDEEKDEEERDLEEEEEEERDLEEEEEEERDLEEEEEEERSDEKDEEEQAELELEAVDDEEEERDGEDPDDEEKEEQMIVEGYAATFNSPYQLYRGGGSSFFERVDARAFDSAEMRDVIMQYDHGGRVFARQSNGTLSLSVDKRGLKVRADLSGTEEGRKLYHEIRGGYTTKMSLSFTIDDEVTEELPEEEVLGFRTGSTDRYFLRTIRKVGRVYDVSAVSLPANEGTEIAARKRNEERERRRLAFNIAFELAR